MLGNISFPFPKPLPLVQALIAQCTEGTDLVLDFFAGSGTLGAAASELGRKFVLVDENPEAISVMKSRVGGDLLSTTTFIDRKAAA